MPKSQPDRPPPGLSPRHPGTHPHPMHNDTNHQPTHLPLTSRGTERPLLSSLVTHHGRRCTMRRRHHHLWRHPVNPKSVNVDQIWKESIHPHHPHRAWTSTCGTYWRHPDHQVRGRRRPHPLAMTPPPSRGDVLLPRRRCKSEAVPGPPDRRKRIRLRRPLGRPDLVPSRPDPQSSR